MLYFIGRNILYVRFLLSLWLSNSYLDKVYKISKYGINNYDKRRKS